MDSRTVSMYSPLGALGGMSKAIGVGLLDSMGFLLSRMQLMTTMRIGLSVKSHADKVSISGNTIHRSGNVTTSA